MGEMKSNLNMLNSRLCKRNLRSGRVDIMRIVLMLMGQILVNI